MKFSTGQWLALMLVLVCLTIGAVWLITTPVCPSVHGFKEQHPEVSCR